MVFISRNFNTLSNIAKASVGFPALLQILSWWTPSSAKSSVNSPPFEISCSCLFVSALKMVSKKLAKDLKSTFFGPQSTWYFVPHFRVLSTKDFSEQCTLASAWKSNESFLQSNTTHKWDGLSPGGRLLPPQASQLLGVTNQMNVNKVISSGLCWKLTPLVSSTV